jgi:pimeloyl-ACP methyl ester carboxylesterase
MRRLGPLFTRQILSRGRDLIKLAWHDPSQLTPEMEEYYLKPYKTENWDKALWEFTLASQPTGLTRRLKELSLPILVVTGDDDRIVPTADSIRLANELPNASIKVIKNAGHVPHEEKPGEFLDAFSEFISQMNSGG